MLLSDFCFCIWYVKSAVTTFRLCVFIILLSSLNDVLTLDGFMVDYRFLDILVICCKYLVNNAKWQFEIMLFVSFRHLESWRCASYVPCIWQSHVEAVRCGRAWNPGLILVPILFICPKELLLCREALMLALQWFVFWLTELWREYLMFHVYYIQFMRTLCCFWRLFLVFFLFCLGLVDHSAVEVAF